MPPGAPISRQVIGAAEPASEALYSPIFSPDGPSGLPVFSTSTAITLSWPVRTAPAGKVNVCVLRARPRRAGAEERAVQPDRVGAGRRDAVRGQRDAGLAAGRR